MGDYFETKDLSVGYDGIPLIEHIKMEVGKGEIVTLIGPNGSGKSTILKSITRHLSAICGTVWIGKNELGRMSYHDLSKKMAVVLTDKIHPELMTCRDVVATGRYPYTGHMGILREEDQSIVNEAMAQVGILSLASKDFQNISDGQRQRVLLARAICQKPEIIILDEPTSFLDVRYKVELAEILKTMAREQHTTVIMSLHEIELAVSVSDKLICVDGEKITFFGTPEEILEENKIYDLYHIRPEVYHQYFGKIKPPKQEVYVYKENKKLKCGFTTGSCAAAAAKAAARMLLEGGNVDTISIKTPKGVILNLKIEQIEKQDSYVRCAVCKDAGDDPDCTDGIYIFAKVEKIKEGICIDGGAGVGRVTKEGLDQPVGEAAINHVPRQMIRKALLDVMEAVSYEEGLRVEISVPGGEEISQKTFNPKLGIEGGISILGTSGIVEPMSEEALIDTIRTEMKIRLHGGKKHVLVTPGNYGRDFAYETWGIDLEESVKCSNYIGQIIDMAYEFQVEHMLLIGHIGKLVKVAAGIMNTHSKMADGRMDVLCSAAVMAGADGAMCREILACATTDAALILLKKWGILESCMEEIVRRISEHVNRRAWEKLQIEVVVFSNEFGVLGQTPGAWEALQWFEKRR